jgi:hypothetical protein
VRFRSVNPTPKRPLQRSRSSTEFVSTVAGLTSVTCPAAAASNGMTIGVVTVMLNSCVVFASRITRDVW